MKHPNYAIYLFFFILFISACGYNKVTKKNYNYPKSSADANFVYNLHSNKTRTHFYVDGQELAIGRKLKVKIDETIEHTIIAHPEGCTPKEEFIQPPYSRRAPLSFTFLMGDCGTNSTPVKIAKINEITKIEADTKPPTITINITNTSRSTSGTHKTNKKQVIITGRIHDNSDLSSVKLNGASLELQNGTFERSVQLKKGLTNFILVAVDKNNNKATKTIKIKRGSSSTTHQIKRTALIIGNSKYKYVSPLDNPSNDAEDMSNTLTALGFDVILKLNETKESIESSISQFGKKLEQNKGLGLFFYAGHGIQIGGENYIIPVDAKIERQKDVKYKAISVDQILDEMRFANNGLNVVILDACRDNPLPRSFSRSSKKGLATIEDAPSGSLIAFATAKGETAADGSGRNGMFTKHLLLNIKKGTSIQKLFERTLKGVKNESSGKQIPWLSTSYTGEFKF